MLAPTTERAAGFIPTKGTAERLGVLRSSVRRVRVGRLPGYQDPEHRHIYVDVSSVG